MKHQHSLAQRVIATLTSYSFFFSQFIFVTRVYADQIVPDGRTQTHLTINGNVTDIRTSTIRGVNAYNSFSKFDVNSGNIANLYVPGSATNLLNLVNGKTSQIDGMLNAYQNGHIGGNVFFANPDGFVVGAGGVVNVGSLSISAPTRGFMNGFFDTNGNPEELATQQLLTGTAPINANALISIQGRVNALDSIRLQAGDISNSGAVAAGSAVAPALGFSDMVNTGDLKSATDIVEKDGEIFITAGNDFTSTGSISVDGVSNSRAGNVVVKAGNNINLLEGSEISAQGTGEHSDGGNILVFADNTAVLKKNAILNASGGLSGDGGKVELSAKDTVELAGGSLQAGSIEGEQGSILIDPANLTISQHVLRGTNQTSIDGVVWNAGDLTLEADEKITVTEGNVISTRQVEGTTVEAHQNGVSIGDSGNLTLSAPKIEMQTGSMLLAHDTRLNPSSGEIVLTATTSPGLLGDGAEAGIVIGGATIKGSAVTMSAGATGDDTLNLAAIGSVTASVDIDNANIVADNGNVSVSTSTNTTATAEGTPFDLSVDAAIVDLTSNSSISIDNSTLDASKNISLQSSADIQTAAVANASANNTNGSIDAAFASTNIKSSVSVIAGNGTQFISGEGTSLNAATNLTADTTADGSAGGLNAAGATVAVSDITTTTSVAFNDAVGVDAAGELQLSATSTENIATKVTSTVGGASGNSDRTKAELNKEGREAETSEGSVNVAAALAVTDLSSTTAALLNVNSDKTITADSVDVSASSERAVETDANASSTNAGTGVGVAVGITVADMLTQAEIKNSAQLETNALTVQALAGSTSSTIKTTSISGAGASNVGVAGSLALSVIKNQNQAIITNGSIVNMGTMSGALEITSESDLEISAIAKSTQEGDDANVGVGASVAVNVANTDTIAEIEDTATLTGAGDVTLSATGSSTVATEAEAGSAGGVAVSPVVGVTVANSESRARLGSGTALTAGGVSISASQTGSVSTTTGADAAGDNVGVGASLAVTVANDKSIATTDRDINASGDVTFAASSDTSSKTIAKASAKGAEEADENGEAKAGDSDVNSKIDEQVAFGESKSDKPDTDTTDADASTSEGGVSVAAAIAVNVGNSTSSATIPDTRTVTSTGAVTLRSVNAMDASASADGTQVSGASTNVGVGAAVAINVANITNQARIGNATVSGTDVSVESLMVKDATSEFNADATSGAGSTGVGVAGALALNIGNANSDALIASEADVTIVAGGDGAVTLSAENATDNKAIAKSTQEGDDANVGVGASAAVNVAINNTTAEIQNDADLLGSGIGDVSINAMSSSTVETEAEAGSAGGVSVTPVVAVTAASSRTLARLNGGSLLNQSGDLSVSSSHKGSVSTKSNADAAGDKVAVGASMAVAVSKVDTEAYISRNITSASGGVKIAASSSTSNTTQAKASAAGAAPEDDAASGSSGSKPSVNESVSSTQSFATDKDKSGSTSSTETEDPDASSKEGQVSVAAAIAVSVTDVDTLAKVDNNITVKADNDVAVSSSANTDASATSDGSAVNSDIGVGVGVAINVARNKNSAFLSQGSDVQGSNISVTAGMTEDDVEGQSDPDTVNSFAANATSGAGASKVGVAGSLALNVVSNETLAYIAGLQSGVGGPTKVHTDGELSVVATNNANHVSMAKSSVAGAGAKVGVGASVAINTFTNTASSEIQDDVRIEGVNATEAGSLIMSSNSEFSSETKGEAGAAGEESDNPNDIAVDASVALVVADNSTTTSIGAADTNAGFTGNIDLQANSKQSNTTEANGDSAGASVAVGAVLAANTGISNTSVSVGTDLQTAGSINMIASSTSADKALAKASAKGASKKKVQDKYAVSEDQADAGEFNANEGTSSSILSDNASSMEQSDTGNTEADEKTADANKDSGNKGKWNVSVAAAVGANVVVNNTKAIVASDKTLAAGSTESIDVKANSDSNYMTLGSGKAVADSGDGGGIGIGVGVAITVTNNNTIAEIASIDGAGDVTVAANSTQNMHDDFIKELTSEAIAGASADKVAVAGAVATVVSNNNTRAEILSNAVIGDIADLIVTSDNQSKISSRAVAWVDPAKDTKAGVGASAALLVSNNHNIARIADGVTIESADSITVEATNHRVTPETVGLNFDDIINKEDIFDSALLDGRTTASDDDSDNTGTEPVVDEETGGPSIIFDKLESTADDAKHALEDYIRSHNYYTEAAAGSASTSGEAKVGVAGSFAVTVLNNVTEASIGNVTIDEVAGKVDVIADTDTNIAGFTGSVVKAGKVGVGVSATTLVNVDSTRALVGNTGGIVSLGEVNNIGDLNVIASSDQDILDIGVSASAASGDNASGAAVSGVLTTGILVNEVKANIADSAIVDSTGSVAVSAEGLTDLATVVGGIALGGKVGVGASVGTGVISGQTHASIGDDATITANDSIAVDATAEEDIISIVVGAGASKKVGVAGSLATNVIAASTTATIGTDTHLTQVNARDADSKLNSISVNAADNTSLFGLAGGGAIGGKAGVGAAADVGVFSKNTIAETKAGSVLIAGGNVDVSAKSKDDIISLTGAGAASSSGAAVAGVASVKVVVDKTQALINSQSVVADGNVDLLAQSDTDLNIYDGTIAISGGSAAVGGAVAVNTLVKDTASRVGDGVSITARGDLENSQVYNGDVDRSGYLSVGSIARPDSDDEPAIGVNAGELTDAEKRTSDHRGLSVTAFTTEDIETIGISASASKNVAVAGNLAVDVIANTTDAAIGAGAVVNTAGNNNADNSASVLVQSYDYSDLNGMLGGGALGVSSAGVGAAGDASAVIKKTTAHIDVGADINAEQDIAVSAGSEEDIDSIAVAVGAGSSAGVSGAASVLVINSETRAYTESNLDTGHTNIDAGRDIVIEAANRTDLLMLNSALAAGSTAGVGGSAGVAVLTNTTEAKVGRGTQSNADRRTVVRADSSENLIAIAMGGAGGGSAGVSGQLGVHVMATNTNAIVEDGVTINKASWLDADAEDEQSVAVIASDEVDLLSISGTISVGGSAGVGGALTADAVLNKVYASVGDSEIYAGSAGNGNVNLGDDVIVEDGVSIRADSKKDLVAISIAGAAGGSAGVAGAASLLIVGSDYDENDKTKDSFGADMDKFTSTGEGAEDSSQLAESDSGSTSRTSDTLGAQGDVEVSEGVSVSQYLDNNTQSSGSSYFSLDSAAGISGDTVAVVASGAKVKTKGDLEISAHDDTTAVVVGGSAAGGGSAGVAGAGALVLLNQGTRAIVQDDDIEAVELDAARKINVNAKAESQIVDVTATVAAGGAAGVSGSLLLNVVDSRAEARIGDSANINQGIDITADVDQSVIVDANNSTNLVATTANGSGSGTAAVGGVALVNIINSKTNASIGESAKVDAERDIKVIADASEQVIANGASAAISGVAGVGGVINANTIVSKTDAVIEAGAVVDSDGNVLVGAEDDTLLVSNAWGVAIGVGGAGVGGSFGVNTIVKDSNATITEGAIVNARGNNETMDVYTGELVDPAAGDTLIDGLISRIKAGEEEDPEESDSSSGPSEEKSQDQADKWQTVVDESGANKGEDDMHSDDSPSLDNSKKSRVSMKGLAVVASSTEDIVSSNASAAGGLYAGVSGSGQVLSVVTETDATVEKGVSIESKDLRLSSADHTRSLSLSGGLAISGVAGVGGVIVSGNMIKSTNATLGSNAAAGEGATVIASGDVNVDADSSDDIDEILVNVAGAGIAGVGGGVASHVVVSETSAEVGNNTVIDGDSDLRVRADSNTEIDTFSGNLSLAGIAAVGGVVSSNVVANTTTARIGDGAKTDADDVTEVLTDSVTNVDAINVAASGGAVGVAGDVAVNVINTTAQSSIGQNALLNTAGSGNVDQEVRVTAADSSTINSDTGTFALGAVAVGGALSVDILRNSASASIGSGAEVNANDRIDISASTVKTMDAKAVSAAAGGFGLSGSIAVAAIGGDLNDDAYSEINGKNESGNENSESGSINKVGSSSSVNPLASDDDNSQLNDFNATSGLADDVDERNAEREADYGVSDDVASSADPRSGTLAVVGSAAKLKAGGDLNIAAQDITSTNMLTGAVGVGAVAGAGAASITVVENNTEAMVASNAELDSGAKLTVSASNEKTLNSEAASGAVSGIGSVAGSIGVTVDSSKAKAHVDNGALINQDSGIQAYISRQRVNVEAINNATIDVKTGAVAASYGAGIGGTVNNVSTNQTTTALIDVGSTGRVSAEELIAVNADSTSTSNALSAVGAAGGVFGVAGGVVILSDDSMTLASIGDGSVIDEADEVIVDAYSVRSAKADTKGAAVGAIGAGASAATVDLHGETIASISDNAEIGLNSSIGSLEVNSSATDTASATAKALSAGVLISGSGALAESNSASSVRASTGTNVKIDATEDVTVSAQAAPELLAESIGVSVSGGVKIGASFANASSNQSVTALLGNTNTVSANNLLVKAVSGLPDSAHSVKANSIGAGGGLLLGLNATNGVAKNIINVDSTVGDDSNLTIGNTVTVEALNNSSQRADVSGINGGIIAAGFNESEASSNSDVNAQIGNNVHILGGDLTIDADSIDNNYADSIAGSGGVVSGSASEAKTSTISNTIASIGNGSIDRSIDVNNINMDARHHSLFNSTVDSTNASLLGASGATANNVSNATVAANFGNNLNIKATGFDVDAQNKTTKQLDDWNVLSGSGGLLDLPAASSKTTITNNTNVNVGAGTTLAQTGSRFNPGLFELDALNNVSAKDKVKMNAGGAIALAKGESIINATTNNASINVGSAAVLQALGDLNMGTMANADVSTTVAVDVFGLAGEPFGDAVSNFLAANEVNISQDAELLSLRDIRLGAGVDSHSNENDISVYARTDLWNNSALPLLHDPVANALINTTNSIDIGTGADVAAVRNIILSTKQGRTSISGVGLGKDIYSETLSAVVNGIGGAFGAEEVSFDRHGGSETNTSLNSVNVDGTARVGIQSKLSLEIDIDGNVTRMVNGEITTDPDEGIRIVETYTTNVADDIRTRINELRQLISEYTTDSTTSDAAIAVAAYEAEIEFLEHKLDELGLTISGEDGGFNGVRKTQLELAEADLEAFNNQLTPKVDEKTAYETENADLTTTNNNLTTANNELTSTNNDLTSQNTTLSNEVTSLTTNRDALDPADYENNAAYQADYDSYTAEINTRSDQITANDTTISSNESTIATNTGIIEINNDTVASNNDLITVLLGEIDDLNASILNIETGITDGIYLDSVDALDVNVIVLNDTTAQLGNIYVHADTLAGDGKMVTPGDAEIVITNKSANFLKLNDLIIPANDGGKLYFNNVDVDDNTDINDINAAGYLKTVLAGNPLPVANFDLQTAQSSISPKIEVISTYDPTLSSNVQRLPNVGPDIILAAGESSTQLTHISNTRGSILIQSAAGNIRLEENTLVSGATVDVQARNGDFIQSYTDAFSHIVGGEPLTFIPADPNIPNDLSDIQKNTLEGTSSGIVANGSVLIAARYLNINGTVQSGIPEWGVYIPDDAKVTIAGQTGTSTFDQAQAHYESLSDAEKAMDGAEFYTVADANVSDLGVGAWGDWAQVTVEYNAKEDRLELGGVQVKGGYIQIFGQVFNTNGNSVEGNARLRVLDGYGEIKVDNLTSKALFLNTLDTGQGVEGKISITNVVGQNSNGSPILENTVFTRNGGARTGISFDPDDYLSGGQHLEYSMTNGSTSTSVDRWLVSRNSWFNVDEFSSKVQSEGTFRYSLQSNEDPLSQGEFLRISTNTSYGSDGVRQNTNTETTSQTVSKYGDGWVDCNWWTLCANATHYQYYNIETGEKTVNTFNVDAGNPIDIEFIGFDKGAVDVTSTGDVMVSGGIINRTGDTNITSRNGSILQTTDFANITGNNITLDAETGIGTMADAIDVAGLVDGVFTATTNTGDINIAKETGDMDIGVVSTNDGRVLLDVDGDINGVGLLADSMGDVIGNRIELISKNGGIGTRRDLKIQSGYTTDSTKFADYGLEAHALDDISIVNVASTNNTSAHLMVVDVESLAGDVTLETNGTIIDNNQIERSDTRAIEELVALWDDMQLRGESADAKDIREIEILEDSVTAEYRRYWNTRLSQEDSSVYDSEYVATLTADQERVMRDQLALRDNDGNGVNNTPTEIDQAIALYIDERTAEFHEQHARLYEQSSKNAIQGYIPDEFVEDFKYTATDSEKQARTEGSHWSDFQLAISVSSSLLKEITDTVTVIEDANVKGNHIKLISENSDIGTIDQVRFELSRNDALDFTDEEKAALAAAEIGDIRVFDDHLIIDQRDDLDIDHGSNGDLIATATTGDVYLGTEDDVRVLQIQAGNEIRLKVEGAIINANNNIDATGVNFIGQRTILEAAHAGIGTSDKSILINLSPNAPLTARAAGDIWIEALNQDLAIGTIFTKETLTLKTVGDVKQVDPNPGTDIRAASLTLDIGGSFGESGDVINAIGIGLNTDGELNATVAGDAFISSPLRDLSINTFSVNGDAEISVGTLTTADINVQNFTNTAGNTEISSTGLMQVVSLEGSSGDVSLTSTSSNVEVDSLDVESDISVSAGKDVVLENVVNNAGVTDIRAGQDIAITSLQKNAGLTNMNAGHDIFIQSLINNGDAIDLFALNSIKAVSMSSSSGLLDLNQVTAAYGTVDITVDGNAVVNDLQAGRLAAIKVSGDSLQLTSSNSASLMLQVLSEGGMLDVSDATVATGMTVKADNIEMPSVLHDPAQSLLHVSASGNDGGFADMINISINSSYGFVFDEFKTRLFDMTFATDNVSLRNIQVLDNGWFSSPTHKVYVDNKNRKLQSGTTAQLYSPDKPFNLTLTDHQAIRTNALVVNYDNDYLVNAFSSENSLLRLANKRLAQSSHAQRDLISGLSPVSMTRLAPPGFERIGYNIERIGIENPDFITDESSLKLIYPATFE